MDKQGEWEFEAPKFWDLSETIPQERPTDAWFCMKNVSHPSFEAPKKRRTLRIFKYSSKSAAQKKLQEPIQKRESVFERLSRESTISFSRKTNQPLTPQQKQLEAHHSTLYNLDDNDDQELIVQSSKETVGERIARLEGTYLDQGKPFGLGKKTIKLKQNINHSSYRHQPPAQTLYDEIQKSYESEERTEETAVSSYSRYSFGQTKLSPPSTGRTSSHTDSYFRNSDNNTTLIQSPSRKEQHKATSSRIPMQNASPIRKSTLKMHHHTPLEVDKVVSNFFDGLLKLALERETLRERKLQEAKEAKAKVFFESLLKNNAAKAAQQEIEAKRGLTFTEFSKENNSNNTLLSPRKRRVSIGGIDDRMNESFKRSRINLNNA